MKNISWAPAEDIIMVTDDWTSGSSRALRPERMDVA